MTARTFSTACVALCAFSILLLFLHHPAKAQDAPTVTDLRVMEERINALEEKVQIQQDALAERESMARAFIRDEAEAENKLLSQKIDIYLAIAIGFLTLVVAGFAFTLTFFGRQAIVTWVEKRTADQVTEYVKAQLQVQGQTTLEVFLKTLEEKGQAAIDNQLNTLDERAKQRLGKIDTLHGEYQQLLSEMRDDFKNTSPTTRLTPEEGRKLETFQETLSSAKQEEDYTAAEWYLSGISSHNNSDFEKALEAFSRTIELNPDGAEAYHYRGYANDELEHYDEALNDYNKAIEIKPDDANAYLNRGVTYDDLKRYDEALNDYNKAIEIKPDFTKAYINRGAAYCKLKRYDEALNDYNKAIDLNPDDATAYKNLAELHIVAHQPEEALTTAEHVLSISEEPEDQAIGMYFKCLALRLLGRDTDEAEAQLSALLAQPFESTWSFQEIKTWVEEADLEPAVKQFIQEKTAMMEKHQRGEDPPSTDDA